MIRTLRSRLSRARSFNPNAQGRALRIGVLGVLVPCLLGCGATVVAIAAPTTPSTTTSTVTAPAKTVTQTQTTTAPAKTTTVTTPTQTNTVIKTQTTTAPTTTTTTSKSNAPAAALGAAAASHKNASKPEESSGLPGWAWALIGAAAVALLIWIVVAIRHWRKGSPPGQGTVPPSDGPPRPASPPL